MTQAEPHGWLQGVGLSEASKSGVGDGGVEKRPRSDAGTPGLLNTLTLQVPYTQWGAHGLPRDLYPPQLITASLQIV